MYHYYCKNTGEELAFELYNKSGLRRIEYNLTDGSFGESHS